MHCFVTFVCFPPPLFYWPYQIHVAVKKGCGCIVIILYRKPDEAGLCNSVGEKGYKWKKMMLSTESPPEKVNLLLVFHSRLLSMPGLWLTSSVVSSSFRWATGGCGPSADSNWGEFTPASWVWPLTHLLDRLRSWAAMSSPSCAPGTLCCPVDTFCQTCVTLLLHSGAWVESLFYFSLSTSSPQKKRTRTKTLTWSERVWDGSWTQTDLGLPWTRSRTLPLR